MKRHPLLTIWLLTALALLPRALAASVMFGPELTWKSIRTEHFWIHYHQGLEKDAALLSVIAENTHRRLSPLIRWQPFFRTDVVLADTTDFANGFSTPFPYNRVQIYITRPAPDSALHNYANWLELVFTHEYTHTLNLDTISGIPSVTRYTLGRVCFPSIFLPIWITEGNAVYHESEILPFGRNNSTYADMVLRMDVTESRLSSIALASHFPRDWPAGNVPYLYGGRFVEYLEKKYGRGVFSDVMIENSDNVLPYLVNYTARGVYGESFPSLWKEWESYLTIRYRNTIRRIESEGITKFKEITTCGYGASLPRFAHNGSALYYIQRTNTSRPALMRYSMASETSTRLCPVHDPNSISVTADGILYCSDAEYYKSFSLYNEAFRYNTHYRQLSSGLRSAYIDVSADGKKSVFISQQRGRYSLVLSDLSFSSYTPVLSGSAFQFAFPRLSPDASKLVFSVREPNGDTGIIVYDIRKNEFLRLTSGRFNDICPSWHPGGDRILLSSDRTGVYNLYEIHLKTGAFARLTNLTGGAFHPDVSPEGATIAFSSYSSRGFNIALAQYPRTPYETQVLHFTPVDRDYFTAAYTDETPEQIPQSSAYSPWRSILPSFWIPIFGSEEIYEKRYDGFYGFSIMGADTLYHHYYDAHAYMYDIQKRAVVGVNYMLQRFYPNFIFSYENEKLFYARDEFPWSDNLPYSLRRKLETSASAGVMVPLRFFMSSHVVTASYTYSETDIDTALPLQPVRGYSVAEGSIRCAYYFSNAAEYPYSISKEDGRDFTIITDIYNKSIGSDISWYKGRAEYAEYIGALPSNSVIMLRGRAGASFGNPWYLSPYNLGRFEKGKKGSPATNEDEFGLRGYPSGMIYGNRLCAGTIEYRTPVVQHDAGYKTLPLLFRDIWGVLFFECGNVWDDGMTPPGLRTSAGIELHMRITIGYYLDVRGYGGFAAGFGKNGEKQAYFGVSNYYEGCLKNFHNCFDR